MNPRSDREPPHEPRGEREERGEPRRPDEAEEPHDPTVSPGQRDPERHPVAEESQEPPVERWPQAGQGVPPPRPGFARPPGPPAGPPDTPHGQQAEPAGYPVYGQPVPVISARVLMFIGAGFGLTLALLFGIVAAIPEATQGIEADAARGLPPQVPLVFGTFALVTGVYGVVSLVLASLMGKRSPVIFWTVLVFQILMLLLPLPSLVSGAPPAVVPLLFTVAIIVSLLFPATRGYYRRSRSPRPATE